VALQACLRLGSHRRRRGREKKDKGTGYLKRNLKDKFLTQPQISEKASKTAG
jgi:hypothetical protein